MTIHTLEDFPQGSPHALFCFAHGAGAPMDSEFMATMTQLLVGQGIAVCRFEFPYMAQRRHTGKKRPPNREAELLACWRQLVAQQASYQLPLFIGGKSMGGRMAAMVANELPVKGVVCLGYPFHPPAKPEKLRLVPLQTAEKPVLIVQGSRDKLGSREEVSTYDLPTNVAIHWLEDGDHDLKPRVRSGFTQQQHCQSAARLAAAFMAQHN